MMKTTLRGIRILCGLTQFELAGECGASPRTVTRWEANERNVPFGVLLYLSERLVDRGAALRVEDGELFVVEATFGIPF